MVSLVAEDQGVVIGHVAISRVTISNGSEGWYGLGPVAVASARQRQGVGTRLVRHALSELQRLGGAGCVVLGNPDYYVRFGFNPEPSLVLPGVPPEYFQVIAFRGLVPSGTVSYHDSFNVKV